jgi:hypothetical protein
MSGNGVNGVGDGSGDLVIVGDFAAVDVLVGDRAVVAVSVAGSPLK